MPDLHTAGWLHILVHASMGLLTLPEPVHSFSWFYVDHWRMDNTRSGMKLGPWIGIKPAATKLIHLHFFLNKYEPTEEVSQSFSVNTGNSEVRLIFWPNLKWFQGSEHQLSFQWISMRNLHKCSQQRNTQGWVGNLAQGQNITGLSNKSLKLCHSCTLFFKKRSYLAAFI